MANWYVRDTGTLGYTAVAQWAATHTYAVGNIVRQLTTPAIGSYRCFRASAITTGISGGSEPTWVLTKNATTADSGVTWTECTGQALYNGDGGGSAWAAPFHTLYESCATGWAAAGDTIYVSSDHNQTIAAAVIYVNVASSATNPVNIISVPSSTVPPTSKQAGAAEATSGTSAMTIGGTAGGSYYIYGVSFTCGTGSSAANLLFQSGVVESGVRCDTCTFTLGTTAGASVMGGTSGNVRAQLQQFYNCTFVFGAVGQSIQNGCGRQLFVNCSFAQTGSVPNAGLFSFNGFGPVVVRDCDLSKITAGIVGASGVFSTDVYLQNCKVANQTFINGTFNSMTDGYVRAMNCDSTGTNNNYYFTNYNGTVTQNTSTYRSNGATDLTAPISWKIVTGTGPKLLYPLICEEVGVWNDSTGSSMTATIFLTSSSTLTNAQFWVEWEYPGSSSTPIGTSDLSSRAADTFATPVTLTTDSTSTWTGGQTNKYQVSLTFTPQIKGVIKARIYVGAASTTIYVDPFIYLSTGATFGKSYFIPGWGYINEGSKINHQRLGGLNG